MKSHRRETGSNRLRAGAYFWGKVWTLAAWCELRDDFRRFRVDRISPPRLGDAFPEDPQKTLEVYLARVRER